MPKRPNFIVNGITNLFRKAVAVPKGSVTQAIIPLLEAEHPNQRFSLNAVGQALRRLEKRGIIQRTYQQGRIVFVLTEKGQEEQSIGPIETTVSLPRPTVWDGKWRIVLFSIPETQKDTRVTFRRALESFGFMLLHRSVWIYPYPCEDAVTKLAKELRIQSNITIVTAENVQPDEAFRTHFGVTAQPEPVATTQESSEDEDLIPLTELP